MGLFDNFKFNTYKLKVKDFPYLGDLTLKEIQEATYQTKDLGETYLGYFYLKKQKNKYRLFHHQIEYVYVEGDKKADSLMDRLGYMDEIGSKEVLVNDVGTNTIRVYEFFQKEKFDYWVEFDLVFIDNILSDVYVSKFEEKDNTDRIEREENWKEKLRNLQQFEESFLGKILNFFRKIHRKFIMKPQRFVGNLIMKFGSWFAYWRF